MAIVVTRPYRRILTSALHRRFVHASALSLLVAYGVAFTIGTKSSFLWSWLPFGACGLRTLLLFISCLATFVLRIGQMHIGSRTTSVPSGTLRHLFPLHVLQTFGWYLFSAWWFSEVYVWSASSGAELGWVKPGRSLERPTLNERPIYLHCYHFLLAISQAVIHLGFDYDRICIPVAKQTPEAADQRTHPTVPVLTTIRSAIPQAIAEAVKRSTLMALVTPLLYQLFLRRTAWSYTLYFAKLFWNFTRAAAEPPKLYFPVTVFLMLRSAISGGLLVFLWQTTNLFFSTFISKEPLKRGQPLTADTKDPTGSLLDGLKAKKEVVKTFAFWELCFISQRLPDRRKAIFSDIDRIGGSAWTQILNASTNAISGITTRIDAYKKPPSSTKAQTVQPPIQTLPRLTKPPKEDNIFAPSPKPTSRQEKLEEALRATAKSYGQAPDWTPIARAKARDMLGRASTVVLSPDRKQKLLGAAQELKLLTGPSKSQPSSLGRTFPFFLRVLRSPLAKPFRQTYARRLRAIVLGTPYGELSPIVDAIESLTRLLTASLTEDTFGKVQTDVPAVVRLFTQTIIALQDFMNGGLDIHWTDVEFPSASDPAAQSRARRVPEVEVVLEALKSSLAELLAAFRLYLGEVGLAGKNLRLARQAAGVDENSS